MPERERRHLLGPILLIFAGALLLLHQTGIWPISWAHLLRAWPLLLVLLGLDIVLGRTRTGRAVFAVLAVGLLLAILLYTPAAHATPALEADSLTYPSRGIETAEISIAIVDDATIAQLHGQYLGDPTPTDVLSFVLEEGDHHLEGEIVASAETAAAWAKRLAWPCENELLLYIVHGTLHLVGFDDQTPAARRKMRREEKAVLHKLGVIPPVRRRR